MKTLNEFIGEAVRVFTRGIQVPPCPPNGYVGILTNVTQKDITVKCKFGYTKEDKVLEFSNEDYEITKIILEESQETIYEHNN